MLDIRPGEALGVNFLLLRMVKSLNPKVVTLVEQKSNTNTAPFVTRFRETLDYYSAMFKLINVTIPRDRKERINVEQQCKTNHSKSAFS